MKPTILVPTDFTPESLILVKTALQAAPKNQAVQLLLVHGISLSNAIPALLFFSKADILRKLMTPEFNAGLQEIKTQFPAAALHMRIDLFTGENQNAFDTYAEANGVSEIVVPNNYAFKKVHKNSKDLMPFIKNNMNKKVGVSWSVQGFEGFNLSRA